MKKDVSDKTAVERYFDLLFKNFGQLVILNLLFFLPAFSLSAIFYGASVVIFNQVNIFIIFLALILITPFYSGVCSVCAKLCIGKSVHVAKDFLLGIKQNIKLSLINGVLVNIMSVLIFLGLGTYYTWAMNYSSTYWIFFITTLFVAIAALFFMFGVFVMTVSFELSATQVYKNSFLAIFGELKNHAIALLGVLVLVVLVYIIALFPGTLMYSLIALILLFALVIPACFTLVYFVPLHKSLVDVIGIKKPEAASAISHKEIEQSLESISDTKNICDDDYIFYNGKMMKHSKLKELLGNEDNSTE